MAPVQLASPVSWLLLLAVAAGSCIAGRSAGDNAEVLTDPQKEPRPGIRPCDSAGSREPAVAGLGPARGPAHDPYMLSTSDYLTSTYAGSAHMSRWSPLVRRVIGPGRPAPQRDYALVMAFIFVESGGRRYAISRSGCLGLTQFCDRTALRKPFGPIFGIDRLRNCACADRRCNVPRPVRRFLETTPRALHPIVAHEVPCDLSDPRFEPERAIRAGWLYISDLAGRFEHNPYLVYIGYNSGPHVAARVWKALGPQRADRLPAIGKVLRKALEPNFGRAWAKRRARSLVRVHLPKLMRIYQTYLQDLVLAP